MGLTVPNVSLSTSIIRDLWRANLRTALTGETPAIADPKKAIRPTGSSMVVTSLPDRSRFYPHIIVGEVSDVASRPDIRADVWLHQYSVSLEIHAETSTHVYQIRDQLRGWIENNTATLEAAGFVDAEITSSVSMSWDASSSIKSWRIVVKGLVYTAPAEA